MALAPRSGPPSFCSTSFDGSRATPFWRGSTSASRGTRRPGRGRTERSTPGSRGTSAVFVGETVEHYPVDGALPCEDGSCMTGDFDGQNTLVWVRDGTAWKVASWQWIKGGLEADRDEWNATYREGKGFNPAPNKFLVEMVKGRKPGLALDVGMDKAAMPSTSRHGAGASPASTSPTKG